MPKYLIVIITIAIVLLAGVGIWWFLNTQPSTQTPQENPQSQESSNTETKPDNSTETEGPVIIFTNDGFEQQSYTVKAGDTVTVKNTSSIVVEFSSDDHPTHRENPEFNLRALQPGQETSFTPRTAGTWGIHDHEHPEFTTTVVVTQ